MKSASAATTNSGVVPAQVARMQRPAAIAEQREATEARGGEAKDAEPVAPPHRQSAADAAQLDPGPHAGSVLRELAPEHDHCSKVLHRDREAQLADESGAPLGGLDRDAADGAQRRARAGPTATTTASRSIRCTRSGHSARLPTIVVGAGTILGEIERGPRDERARRRRLPTPGEAATRPRTARSR